MIFSIFPFSILKRIKSVNLSDFIASAMTKLSLWMKFQPEIARLKTLFINNIILKTAMLSPSRYAVSDSAYCVMRLKWYLGSLSC